MIVIASGFVVPIATLLYCVIFGESADLRKRLVGAYRTLLLSKLFLLVANALLLAACGFLLYLMFSYRSITITLGESAQVYLNDAVGSLQFIGEWKRDQSRAVRMPVGDHYLVAKEPISGKVIASLPVKVRPPWQMCNCDRISLEIQQRPFHPLR
jgi:hypothetical protein